MIKREKHNVTTFLRRDEAPSCLKSHMENANKKMSEPYSQSELERFTKNITVYIHDVYEKNDLREQFCIVINDWLDVMPEADEMLEHDRKKYRKEMKRRVMVSRKRSDRMDQLLKMYEQK